MTVESRLVSAVLLFVGCSEPASQSEAPCPAEEI